MDSKLQEQLSELKLKAVKMASEALDLCAQEPPIPKDPLAPWDRTGRADIINAVGQLIGILESP